MTDKLAKRVLWGLGGMVIGTIISMIIAVSNRDSVLANTYSMMANAWFGLLIAGIVSRKLYLGFRPKEYTAARVLAHPEEYTTADLPTQN